MTSMNEGVLNRLTLRTMSREEFSLAIDWAAREGWNPGLHDAAPFWAADPGGYLIGLVDGEPVAVISAVRYGEHFGFIGFYIVKPGLRGKGHGLAIWQAAIRQLQGRTAGLDGVISVRSTISMAFAAYLITQRDGRGVIPLGELEQTNPLGESPVTKPRDH
ncbi:MAG: GNAT family N-acetyltransferase, partial [Sulfuritalea sp.]|nr:GNAT family N-acetyltransferase [Sulfuritalea sp.]